MPKYSDKPKTVLLSIRMTEQLRDRLNEQSGKWGVSREACIRAALVEYLNQDQDAPPVELGIKGQRAKPERFQRQTPERRVSRGPTRPGRKWRTRDRSGFKTIKPKSR